MTKIETVSIIYQHPKILLGMKKVRFGKSLYNGFGGGKEEYETIEECALRETFEETGGILEERETLEEYIKKEGAKEKSGIIMLNSIKVGNILFHFQSDENNHDVHFFKATKFIGIPTETKEMRPEQFHIDKIPYEQMWPDDKYWLPLLLNGKLFRGEFEFNLEGKIATYELKEVSGLD